MTAPFPWHALPRVSSAHVHTAARVRRAWGTVSCAAIASSLRELVNHPVAIEIRRVTAATTHKLDLGARGTVIVLGDERRPSPLSVAVEIEAELALAIASTLTGGKLPRAVRGRKVDPEVAGALAGVAQWLARTSVATVSIVAIEPERLSDHLGVDALAIDLTVGLGVLRTAVRLAVSVPELDATPDLDAQTTLRLLGETPLSLHVVCASGLARAADLARVARGDVVVVEKTELTLAAADASVGLRVRAADPADVEGNRRVVLEDVRVQLAAGPLAAEMAPNDASGPMNDDAARDATMQLPALDDGARLAEDLAELPLQVRVEMGTATLPAREWATLGAGDVLVLDRRVGDAVTLRIGGRALARGELVDVDGAIGVRITERLA